jgi:hypothetical protein
MHMDFLMAARLRAAGDAMRRASQVDVRDVDFKRTKTGLWMSWCPVCLRFERVRGVAARPTKRENLALLDEHLRSAHAMHLVTRQEAAPEPDWDTIFS